MTSRLSNLQLAILRAIRTIMFDGVQISVDDSFAKLYRMKNAIGPLEIWVRAYVAPIKRWRGFARDFDEAVRELELRGLVSLRYLSIGRDTFSFERPDGARVSIHEADQQAYFRVNHNGTWKQIGFIGNRTGPKGQRSIKIEPSGFNLLDEPKGKGGKHKAKLSRKRERRTEPKPKLSHAEKNILRVYSDNGRNGSAAGRELGISRQRVSAVLRKARRLFRNRETAGSSIRADQTLPTDTRGQVALTRDVGTSDGTLARKVRVPDRP